MKWSKSKAAAIAGATVLVTAVVFAGPFKEKAGFIFNWFIDGVKVMELDTDQLMIDSVTNLANDGPPDFPEGLSTTSNNIVLKTGADIQFFDDDDSDAITFGAGAAVNAYTFILPDNVGADNAVLQTFNATGNTAWRTALELANGTAALPAYAFVDTSLGMFSPAASELGFSTSGVVRVIISGGDLNLETGTDLRMENPAGTNIVRISVPTSITDYNMILPGAVGADRSVLQASNATGTLTFGTNLKLAAGAATSGNLTYSFLLDPDTGIYNPGVDELGLGVGGAIKLKIEGSDVSLQNGISLRLFNSGNTNAIKIAPPSSITNYTMTLPTAVGATGSVLQATNGTGTLTFDTKLQLQDGAATAGNLTYGFLGQNNKGMFSAGSNQIGFATNGAQQFRIENDNISLVEGQKVRFWNVSATNWVELVAPVTISENHTMQLPPDSGDSGDVLQTNGSGVTIWSDAVSTNTSDISDIETTHGTSLAAGVVGGGGGTPASSGQIGEAISEFNSGGVAFTDGAEHEIDQISLGAGNWIVTIILGWDVTTGGATTLTWNWDTTSNSVNSGNVFTIPGDFPQTNGRVSFTPVEPGSMAVASFVINISVADVYYVNGKMSGSAAGVASIYSQITAHRIH